MRMLLCHRVGLSKCSYMIHSTVHSVSYPDVYDMMY